MDSLPLLLQPARGQTPESRGFFLTCWGMGWAVLLENQPLTSGVLL